MPHYGFWDLVAIFGLLGYVALNFLISALAARGSKTSDDYYAGGRNSGLLLVAMSLFATWFGAETVMGASAAIAESGLSAARAEPFGYTLCFVGMALFIAAPFRERGYLTYADFFRERFGAGAERASALVTIPVSITWAAAQLTALAVILHSLLKLDPVFTLGAAGIIVITYSLIGGIAGDILTDTLQGIILITGLVIIVVALVISAGGLGPAFSQIPAPRLALISGDETWLDRIDAWSVPILGSLVTQEAISRFLGAKSVKVARNACYLAAVIYLCVGLLPVTLGLVAPGLGITANPDDADSFLPALAHKVLGPIGFTVIMGALVSAIFSTVNSNLLAASAFATQNLGIKTQSAMAGRIGTFIAGLGALAVSFIGHNNGAGIYDLIQITSALGTSGILVATLVGLNSRYGGLWSALLAIMFGMICNIVTMLVLPHMLHIEVSGGFLLSILLSLFGYLVGVILQRPPAQMLPTGSEAKPIS